MSSRFYSLSRGAYSGTSQAAVADRASAVIDLFLFAVARGVQRNGDGRLVAYRSCAFLFAVARGVQRNSLKDARRGLLPVCFYSLSRGAYSGTMDKAHQHDYGASFYSLSRGAYSGTTRPWHPYSGCCSFLFAVARGVQRNWRAGRSSGNRRCVSIRCREGRTAEPYPLRRGCDQHKRCPFSHPTS